MAETINHPKHYNMGGELDADGSAKYETIKLIEDLGWGFAFCMGNALKYVLRAPHKHETELEDLKKALWYLTRARSYAQGLVSPVDKRTLPIRYATAAWGLARPGTELLEQAVLAIAAGDAHGAWGYVDDYVFKLKERDRTVAGDEIR